MKNAVSLRLCYFVVSCINVIHHREIFNSLVSYQRKRETHNSSSKLHILVTQQLKNSQGYV